MNNEKCNECQHFCADDDGDKYCHYLVIMWSNVTAWQRCEGQFFKQKEEVLETV